MRFVEGETNRQKVKQESWVDRLNRSASRCAILAMGATATGGLSLFTINYLLTGQNKLALVSGFCALTTAFTMIVTHSEWTEDEGKQTSPELNSQPKTPQHLRLS